MNTERNRVAFAAISVAGFVSLTLAGFLTGGVGLGIWMMFLVAVSILVTRFLLKRAGFLKERR